MALEPFASELFIYWCLIPKIKFLELWCKSF